MKKTRWYSASRSTYLILAGLGGLVLLVLLLIMQTTAEGVDTMHAAAHWLAAFGSILLAIAIADYTLRLGRVHRQTAGKLMDTERSFHALFASNPDPLLICNRRTLKFIDVNDAAVRTYGYTRDEFLQMTLLEIRPPEEIPLLLTKLAEADDALIAFRDMRHRTKDGRVIDVEIASQSFEVDGEPGLLITSRDISERKRAEDEIRRLNAELEKHVNEQTSELAEANVQLKFKVAELQHTHSVMELREARSRAMVDDQDDLVVSVTTDGRLIFANQAARRAFSLHETLVQTSFFDLLPPEIGPQIRTFLSQLTRENPVGTLELQLRLANGGVRWFGWLSRAVYDKYGHFMEYQGVARDITERKQRERELEAIATTAKALRDANSREAMLDIVIEQVVSVLAMAGTALIMYDPETDENVFERVRGVHAHTQGSRQPVTVGLTGRVTGARRLYINQDISTSPEMQGILKDDDPRSVAAVPLVSHEQMLGALWISSFTPISPDDVQILSAISEIAANAIERVELMNGLESRVVARTMELRAGNARLQELDQLKTKFIHDISHELRTPLSVINATIYMLENGAQDRRRKYFDTLKQQMTRLADLIEDILKFADLDEEAETIVTSTNLNTILSDVMEVYAHRAALAGLTLETILPPDPILLYADKEMLRQAFTDLLSNAIAYTSSGTVRIQASVDKVRNCVVVTVEDTGTGISPDDLPHIFEAFYRGQAVGQYNIPGSGIGLSVVQKAIQSHNGTIQVESKVGEGSTFTVELPLAQQ